MNIVIILIAIIGGIAGIFSTIFSTVSLPAVIVWKIYRKIRFGISVMK